MKKILLFSVILFSVFQNKAHASNPSKTDSATKFYLGIGAGNNAYTGILGLSGNYRINKLFIQSGVGFGTWGTKYSLGLRYDMKYNGGWAFGIGYSYSSGVQNVPFALDSTESKVSKKTTINYLPASTINLKVIRNWNFCNSNTFYLEFGYSIALQTEPWKVIDGTKLSDLSNSVFNFSAPGGIIFGFGFTFGL